MKGSTYLYSLLLVVIFVAGPQMSHAQEWQKVDFQLDNLDIEEIRKALLPYFPVLRNTELRIVHQAQSPVGWHLSLKQSFQGKLLYQSELRLHLDKKLHVYGLTANLYPLIRPHISYSRSHLDGKVMEVVVERAASDWQGGDVWYVKDNKWHPAYQLKLFFDQGAMASEELILDAIDQSVLQNQDLATYFDHHSMRDSSGMGRVFMPDPCTKAQSSYGYLFKDFDDRHEAIFESLMDTVILEGLTYSTEDSLFYLEGPYVKIVDRAAHFAPVAVSEDGHFFFDRDENGFEEVMAYYHIHRFRSRVARLGFGDLFNRPVEVDAHGFGNNDQSAFIGNGGQSYILFGDGGVDDAEDADVIIHEYAHALSYDASPESNKGFERKGIDEGYADYFAAAYSYDISTWNWFELFNWDGQNEFWQGRKVISLESYPPEEGFSSIYEVGTFWASTLMNIRFDLGGQLADPLVLQSLYFLRRNMELPEVAEALLRADTVLYDGIYSPVIRDRLCQKNLVSSPFCISVQNEASQLQQEVSALTIGPNPVTDRINISWQEAKNMSIQLENMYGQVLWKKMVYKQKELAVDLHEGILPGYYLLRLKEHGGGSMVHKLNIVAH